MCRCPIQDTDAATSDRIAGYDGAHARKQAFAQAVTGLGMALTINAVIHRANIAHLTELVDLAASLGAGRVEIAHAQYYGWALRNRDALMPTREQIDRAMQEMDGLQARYAGKLVDRFGHPGLLRQTPEALHGRLGTALVERDAVRPGAALPRGADHSRAWSSGRCATTAWRISGRIRPPSRRSAAPHG